MAEWTLGAILDAIAEAVPDRVMTVCAERESTFAESADRTRRLANFLAGTGFGAHREREALEHWECGQDRVALIMHNDLYPDMVIGCLKARTVPVNINHYYTPREVGELLAYVKPRGIIYHRASVRSSPTCCLQTALTCWCRSTTEPPHPGCRARSHWKMHWHKEIPIVLCRRRRKT